MNASVDFPIAEIARLKSALPLNDQIHQKLRWNLASGVYKPEQRLSTRALAGEFGTSVMPVREALKRLVAERILVVEPNSAFRVPKISRARGVQLFEIRKTLEMLATRHAIPNLTRAHIDLLRKVDNDTNEAIRRGDSHGYFAANYSFHFLIYSAANNIDLSAIIEGLWMQIGPFFASILEMNSFRDGWQIYHSDIIEAVRSGNADEAALAIARDIDSAKAYFAAATDEPIDHAL